MLSNVYSTHVAVAVLILEHFMHSNQQSQAPPVKALQAESGHAATQHMMPQLVSAAGCSTVYLAVSIFWLVVGPDPVATHHVCGHGKCSPHLFNFLLINVCSKHTLFEQQQNVCKALQQQSAGGFNTFLLTTGPSIGSSAVLQDALLVPFRMYCLSCTASSAHMHVLQDALVAAAVAAGVPQQVVVGDMSRRSIPRLISAILVGVYGAPCRHAWVWSDK